MQPPPPDTQPTNFDEALQSFHITLEETRRQIQTTNTLNPNTNTNNDDEEELIHVIHTQAYNLEQIAIQLDGLIRFLSDGVANLQHSFQAALEGNGTQGREEEDVRKIMTQHCASRALEMSVSVLRYITTGSAEMKQSKGESSVPDLNTECQASLARIVELGLRLSFTHSTLHNHHDNNNNNKSHEETVTTIQELYSSYQRKLLRKRSKPCIAHLAKLRRTAATQNCSVTDLIRAVHHSHEEEEDHQGGGDDDIDDDEKWKKQPHGHAITVILGEASSLIHPLVMWRNGLSPPEHDPIACHIMTLCNTSIQNLNEEAQTLGTTVGEWFISDRDVVSWNKSAADEHQKTTLQQSNVGITTTATTKEEEEDLALLDSTLEEMAYLCQVISRYNTFHGTTILQQQSDSAAATSTTITTKSTPLDLHLQEQSLYYSTMETYLATKNFQRALDLASPVEIVLGCPSLKVPSVVEDASYVSSRAIERASSTLCERCVWTVGHWVCELWSADNSGGGGGGSGVCGALLEGRGCEEHPLSVREKDEMQKRSGGNGERKKDDFASNFLDALDEDIGVDDGPTSPPRSGGGGGGLMKSAPTSGGLRGAFSLGMGMVGSVSSNVVGGVTGGVVAAATSSAASTRKKKKSTAEKEEEARNNAKLCVLNGLNSASAACDSLSGVFDGLLIQQQQQQQETAGSNNGGSNATPLPSSSSSSSVSMVQLSRDELSSHSKSYRNLLRHHIQNILIEWGGIYQDDGTVVGQMQMQHSTQCFPTLHRFMKRENYDLGDSASFGRAEVDERLEDGLLRPLKESVMVRELRGGKCDAGVTLILCEEMSSTVAQIFLAALLTEGELKKRFTDWGSLLLSKQVRVVQNFFTGLLLNEDHGHNNENGEDQDNPNAGAAGSNTGGGGGGGRSENSAPINTATILQRFEKLNQAVTVLQLDKPSDWLAFSYGKKGNSLTMDELRQIMSLRVDFSEDAIAKVCGTGGGTLSSQNGR